MTYPEVKASILKFLPMLHMLAQMTRTPADDAAVRAVEVVLTDPEFDAKMAEYKPKLPRWIHDEHMPQWERELRTGNPGETLGMEGREATHRMLTRIAREKPE